MSNQKSVFKLLPQYYLLGILLSKGKIQVYRGYNYIDLIFEIRFNKPNTVSLRSDNIHNIKEGKAQEMYDFLLPDIIKIWKILETEFQKEVFLEHLPEPKRIDDFAKKIARFVIRKIKLDNLFIRSSWGDDLTPELIKSNFLDGIPICISKLLSKTINGNLTQNDKSGIKSFLMGIADASAVIPGPESAAFGHTGTPRIQIEVDNTRWKLNLVMCLFLQKVMNVPVLNINWPHPTIKGRKGPEKVLLHNHQFRAHAWFFKSVGFNLSIKKNNFQQLKNKIEKQFKDKQPKYCPENRKDNKFTPVKEYKLKYPKVQGLTTTPYSCSEHSENFELLPDEIRGKHYAEFRHVCLDLGCSVVKPFFDNNYKIFNK